MFALISPNMLKTFDVCPRKFYLRYVKNISMPVNDDIFEFGKNIHALASYYLRGYNIEKMELSLTEKEKQVWEYLKSISYFSYEVVNTEYSLSIKLGDYVFGGRIDALLKNGNQYYILDYKTGSVPKNAKFDYQTMIYMLAVHNFFKTDKITFVYIDLKNKLEEQIISSQDLLIEYEKRLLLIAGKINSDFIDVQKTDKCMCEYSVICY